MGICRRAGKRKNSPGALAAHEKSSVGSTGGSGKAQAASCRGRTSFPSFLQYTEIDHFCQARVGALFHVKQRTRMYAADTIVSRETFPSRATAAIDNVSRGTYNNHGIQRSKAAKAGIYGGSYGKDHRDRKSKGRRGQDHDLRESVRLSCGGGQARAACRLRPAGKLNERSRRG